MWRGIEGHWEALNTEPENLGVEVPDFIHEWLEDRLRSLYSRESYWRRAIVGIYDKSKSVYRAQKNWALHQKP
jgi:hypothetical protein